MNHFKVEIGSYLVTLHVRGKYYSVASFNLYTSNLPEDNRKALDLAHAALVRMDGGVSMVTPLDLRAHVFELLKRANFSDLDKLFVSEEVES